MVPASAVPAELVPEIRAAKPVLLLMLAVEDDGHPGYLADDLDDNDRSVLRWLTVTSHPSQTWRYGRSPKPK